MSKRKLETEKPPHEFIPDCPLEKILPLPWNPNRHSAEQLDNLEKLIRGHGTRDPIEVDRDYWCLSGHARLAVAKRLSLKTFPVLRYPDWTVEDDKVKAYVFAANENARKAEIDMKLANQILNEIDSGAFDMELTGLLEKEREQLATWTPEDMSEAAGEDEVPDPPKKAKTNRGDIYRLGAHRLMCGDSSEAAEVAALMGGEKSGLCFTSPPYGQQREYTQESKEKISDWDGLMCGVFGNIPMLDDGQVLVNLGLIHRDNSVVEYWRNWIEFMKSSGWRFFAWYVWDQGAGLPADWNGRLAPSFEFVFHFNKRNIRPNKFIETKPESQKAKGKKASIGFRKEGGSVAVSSPDKIGQCYKIPDSVIRINRNSQDGKLHPATFPVSFAVFNLMTYPGLVYEPFCGSGSTIIAAEKLGRKCFGMEISPLYCDVIVARWEKFTGKKAELVK